MSRVACHMSRVMCRNLKKIFQHKKNITKPNNWIVTRGDRYIKQPILIDNISILWVMSTIHRYPNIAHLKNINKILILINRPPLDVDIYWCQYSINIFTYINVFGVFKVLFVFFWSIFVHPISMVDISRFWVLSFIYRYWNIAHLINLDEISISKYHLPSKCWRYIDINILHYPGQLIGQLVDQSYFWDIGHP
jgi:hypothetical protein